MATAPEPCSATVLLGRAQAGDERAAAQLFDLLYGELRRGARAILQQDAGCTLQPTVLVHEAWLKLVPGKQPSVQDRAHFLRLAAAAMRSVLIDHLRARRTQKRGGGQRVELDVVCELFTERAHDLLELDSALQRLQELDPMLARVVELRFFGGLEVAQVAEALEVSTSTVERAWRTARTWLRAELQPS
ncbi:MAG: ECF-type sigma factor [Planctomycetota bacterium]